MAEETRHEPPDEDDLLRKLLQKQMTEMTAERTFRQMLSEMWEAAQHVDETSASSCSTAAPSAPERDAPAPERSAIPVPLLWQLAPHGPAVDVPFELVRGAVEFCYAERVLPTTPVVAFFLGKLAQDNQSLSQVSSSNWIKDLGGICESNDYFVVRHGPQPCLDEIYFAEEPEWFSGWWSSEPVDLFGLQRVFDLRESHGGKPHRSLGELIQCGRAAFASSARSPDVLRPPRRAPSPVRTPTPPPPPQALAKAEARATRDRSNWNSPDWSNWKESNKEDRSNWNSPNWSNWKEYNKEAAPRGRFARRFPAGSAPKGRDRARKKPVATGIQLPYQ